MFSPDLMARLASIEARKRMNFAVKLNLQMQFNDLLRGGGGVSLKLQSKDIHLLRRFFQSDIRDEVVLERIVNVLKKVVCQFEPRIVVKSLLIALRSNDERVRINTVTFSMVGSLCTGQAFEYLVCGNLDNLLFSIDEVDREFF